MVLLLYGADTFRLHLKTDKIKNKFLAKDKSGLNLKIFDGDDINFSELQQSLTAMPFLASNRLVIVKNLLLSKKNKQIEERLGELIADEKIPASTVLLLVEEGEPDKRKALFKKLARPKLAEKFDLLTGSKLEAWISKRVEEKNGKIDRAASARLASYVGSDLWQMENEIDKLLAHSDGKPIESGAVEKMVRAKLDENIFNFTDALGRKDSKQALRLLHHQLESGAHYLYLLTMIVYQFRNLLIVKDLADRKKGQYQIAKEGGLHPFVVQKTLRSAEKFTPAELKKIYRQLLELDSQLKSTSVDPVVLLDEFVAKVCL